MGLLKKLSAHEVESQEFLTFCYPTNYQLEDKTSLNEWLERIVILCEDLKLLLSLPVSSFWNQILFDCSWSSSLDSFLTHAPRSHDLSNIPEKCKVAMGRVSQLYLLAIKRMSLHNEDESLQFSQDEFAEVIYENYVFDAAKILDICSIYYRHKSSPMSDVLFEAVNNIFKCQPSYYDDLDNAVQNMIATINTMQERLEINSIQERLEPQRSKANKATKENAVNAQDMLLFIFDLVKTFMSLLHVNPHTSKVFFHPVVIGRFGVIYESIVPDALNLVECNRKKYKYIAEEIKHCLATLVDTIIQHAFIKILQQNSAETNLEELAQEYINILDSITQCPNFLGTYCKIGSLFDDFTVIESSGYVDISSLDYVKNMVSSVVANSTSDKVLHQLRELLPLKSEDFLRKCIKKYGENVDVIINNVMEGHVPDDVIPVNQKQHKVVLVPNKNILEDNKDHVQLVKASLNSITYDSDDEFTNSYDNVYEDEYDDTYDSQNVAAQDADSADELSDLAGKRKNKAGDESGSETDEENSKKTNNEENRNGGVGYNRRGARRGARGYRGGPRGNSRGRGKGGNAESVSGNAGGPRETAKGRFNGNPRGRGGGRGSGRGDSKRHRRFLSDQKKSKGMMPF